MAALGIGRDRAVAAGGGLLIVYSEFLSPTRFHYRDLAISYISMGELPLDATVEGEQEGGDTCDALSTG